jgi:hypothetical protein
VPAGEVRRLKLEKKILADTLKMQAYVRSYPDDLTRQGPRLISPAIVIRSCDSAGLGDCLLLSLQK